MADLPEDKVGRDLSNRQWTVLDGMPHELHRNGYGCSAVAWDDKRVIITGGYDYGNELSTKSAIVYNKETMEIESTSLPSMIEARRCHASAIVGGHLLFVIGGYGALETIEWLDLNDPQEWRTFPCRLETGRYHCTAVAVNEQEMFIIGGANNNSEKIASVEIVNISMKTILQGQSLLEARCECAAVLIGSSIVVAGGAMRVSEKLVTADKDSQWERLEPGMNEARRCTKGAGFGNCMVVLGGYNENFKRCKTLEMLNGATGTWTTLRADLSVKGPMLWCVNLGEDLVCCQQGQGSVHVHCLFSENGLLDYQKRQIQLKKHLADKRVELVIPLLLVELCHRGWDSLAYECLCQTSARLIRPFAFPTGKKRKFKDMSSL